MLQSRALQFALTALLALLALGSGGCSADKAGYLEGYYRYGFEQSAYYPVGGGGPYWLEAEGEVWEQLHSYYVDAPGRGGGMTLRLAVEGELEADDSFSHLGAYEKRLTVTSILYVEAMSAEEFQMMVFGTSTD